MTAEVSSHEGAPPPKLDTEAFLKYGFGPDRAFECHVAETPKGVVGHVSFTCGFDVQEACKTVWVTDLFVDAAHRRSGIGRALMAEVCKRAMKTGAGHVQFMTAPDNREAAAFYAAIGSRRDRGVPMFLSRDTMEHIAEQSL